MKAITSKRLSYWLNYPEQKTQTIVEVNEEIHMEDKDNNFYFFLYVEIILTFLTQKIRSIERSKKQLIHYW